MPHLPARAFAALAFAACPIAWGCGGSVPPPAPSVASAARSGIAEGDRVLEIGGARIAVHVRGHGPPCLVHPGGPGLEWTYLRMPLVEKTLTLVYVEPLGTGGSSRVDKALLTRQRYADDLEGVRVALALEKTCLIGHSYGGAVALLYATKHSEHVSRLVLFDTTPRFDEEFGKAIESGLGQLKDEPWYADAMAAWGEEEKVETDEQATKVARREMPTLFGEWTKRHAEYEPIVSAMHAFAAPLRGSQIDTVPFDVRKDLPSVKAPTLIVVGKLDRVTGPRFAEEMHAGIAGSVVVVLEHSGHMGHIEEPEAFAGALREFVASTQE